MPSMKAGLQKPDRAYAGLNRRDLQQAARRLGLPATGRTERIARLLHIATSNPLTWRLEDFDEILPHLSVHQDVRGNADVEILLREGLCRGMVDPAAALEPGAKAWSWARGYLGLGAFVLVTGSLRFAGNGNPRLGPGNLPLFHVRPLKGTSLWDALRAGEVVMTTRNLKPMDIRKRPE